MRSVLLGWLVLALSLPAVAEAQSPGSYVRRPGAYGGPLQLHAYFYAADTCQAALSARRGAPAGRSVAPGVMPVTIVVGPNPAGCGNSRIVNRVMNVGGPNVLRIIQIFFVDPAGRVLKIERVSS